MLEDFAAIGKGPCADEVVIEVFLDIVLWNGICGFSAFVKHLYRSFWCLESPLQ
ncbi:hypothetical protein STEG23_016227, partial [Scotinomys teguina]